MSITRMVTGHRSDGRSTVLMDGPAPNVKQRAAGNASTLDYVMVLEGESVLLLDEGEVELRARADEPPGLR